MLQPDKRVQPLPNSFAAMHESAFGTKPTYPVKASMSGFRCEADMTS
jgi:hypothetical protein